MCATVFCPPTPSTPHCQTHSQTVFFLTVGMVSFRVVSSHQFAYFCIVMMIVHQFVSSCVVFRSFRVLCCVQVIQGLVPATPSSSSEDNVRQGLVQQRVHLHPLVPGQLRQERQLLQRRSVLGLFDCSTHHCHWNASMSQQQFILVFRTV